MISSDKFNIVSENELTEVLAHFNTEFIMSIIDTTISKRHDPTAFMCMPNVVDSWEANFNEIIQRYSLPEMTERVINVRNDTYREIIKRICSYHGLTFTIDNVDLYTAASFMYHFFVGNFMDYMDKFFAHYIVQEYDAIYTATDIANLKKNKDTSTIYAKRVFKEPKIAIISANIDAIITYICGMNFDLNFIFTHCGMNPNMIQYMSTLVSEQDSFFRNHYVSIMMNDWVKPIHLSNIRFLIRNLTGSSDEVLAPMAVQQTTIIDPPV